MVSHLETVLNILSPGSDLIYLSSGQSDPVVVFFPADGREHVFFW